MRNQDDLPYIVVERDSGGSFGSFCLGALVGAGLALLFRSPNGSFTGATSTDPSVPRVVGREIHETHIPRDRNLFRRAGRRVRL